MPPTSRVGASTAASRHGVAILASALVACGARTSLSPEGEAAGGGGGAPVSATSSSGTSSPSTSAGGAEGGGGSGTGEGGAPAACETLLWAGEPVFLGPPGAPLAKVPSLIPLGERSVAVVFEEVGGGSTLVSSAVDPWSTWPPRTGPVDAHFPVPFGGSPVAVSEGDAGDFAFATSDGVGGLVLGQSDPGGSSFLELPGATGAARFLARAAGAGPSPFLVGHGPPTALVVSRVGAFAPGEVPVPLGPFGCADRPVATDVTVFGAGFAVASTADGPLDDCLDPDFPGPPIAGQVHVFDRAGMLLGADAIEREVALVDIRVAERDGGGWLATLAEGDTSALIQPVGAEGTIDAYALHYGLLAGGDFALRGWSSGSVIGGLATLQTGPIPESPSDSVVVTLFDASFGYVAHTPSSPRAPLRPTGRPALLVGPGGRSFLVAFEQTGEGPGGAASTIALLRADCAPL
jgi:hypothetical protein